MKPAHSAASGPAAALSDYDKQWVCAICETWKVVPNLARDCEQRHLEECE